MKNAAAPAPSALPDTHWRRQSRRSSAANATRSDCRSRRIDRAGQADGGVAAGDARLVERVEQIKAELNLPTAADLNVPRNRCINDGVETSSEIVRAGLQPDASGQRAGERGGVELPVGIAAAARSRIADDADAAAVG